MIYIVEDDENIREMENYALRSSGYETVCCESGAELFTQLRADQAKMILLDLMLPGEDGLSILRRLHSEAKTAQIPVIIVSAKAEESLSVALISTFMVRFSTLPEKSEKIGDEIVIDLPFPFKTPSKG